MDTTFNTPNTAPTIEPAADGSTYDEAYRFGRRPTSRAPFPFTERQFARLLIVRSRLQMTLSAEDQAEEADEPEEASETDEAA